MKARQLSRFYDTTGTSKNNISKDMERIDFLMDPINYFISQTFSHSGIMSASKLFKEHSKFLKKPNGLPNSHVTKTDLTSLLYYFFKTAEPSRPISIRDLSRASVVNKDKIFTYFAYNYPSLMLQINDILPRFDFFQKLHDVSSFTNKWNDEIARIQSIKNTLPKLQSDNTTGNHTSSVIISSSENVFQDPTIINDFSTSQNLDLGNDSFESYEFFAPEYSNNDDGLIADFLSHYNFF